MMTIKKRLRNKFPSRFFIVIIVPNVLLSFVRNFKTKNKSCFYSL